jgi:L-ascorbate metabolism protein UlaG (beta-lactamase superfamily)
MKLTRFKQSCFLIEINNKRIYLDPNGIPEGSPEADLILISHSHSDHYELSSVENICSDQSIIICPESCSKIVSQWKAIGVSPRDTITKKGIDIQAVPMYNLRFFRRLFHRKSKNLCGYILSTETTSIYHAGDTDVIPEMEYLPEIDYAFLPIGGMFTMNSDEALEAIRLIDPSNLIPMHELRTKLGEFEERCSENFPEMRIITLQNGENREV